MSLFTLLMVFLTKYLVPFLFAIGLIHFLYGVIEYFIVGQGGDEERAEHGRDLFLKSIVWIVLALLVHFLVLLIGWIGTVSLRPDSDSNSPNSGITPRVNESILQVPNAPSRQDQ
ncbi:hypothetical protein A2837_00600 [Candidatus Kaiserbacteria bacterium RIFCSPHIGHO2_01_FULL_46_22]|uniref:Uncharacterized protein n=1 Tax=Candidatus Kaiserbacteria bacterium RIFCSPHIGHO2_01_FULL_46_22 TaxID=1798475 RepID=A0A1F6BXJ8_9BACT|nr:MAG: hypothetical protein A2837_00600 [Candidatus Kaiserbacteria bacterium RIFCSPHIGHO2_01_FULL_46_22]